MYFTYEKLINKLSNGKIIQVVGPTGYGKTYSIKKACEIGNFNCITLNEKYEEIPITGEQGVINVIHLDHPHYWIGDDIAKVVSRGFAVIEEDRPIYRFETLFMPDLKNMKCKNHWKSVIDGECYEKEYEKTIIRRCINSGIFIDNLDYYKLFEEGINAYYGVSLLRFIQGMIIYDHFKRLDHMFGLNGNKRI